MVQAADTSRPSRRGSTDGNLHHHCPFTARKLAPAVLNLVKNALELSKAKMKGIVCDYVREEFMSDGIVRALVKKPEEFFLVIQMRKLSTCRNSLT